MDRKDIMERKLKNKVIRLLREGEIDEIVRIGISATPLLIAALKDKEWDVRMNAAEAIGKIAEANPDSKEILKAIPDLINALNDEYLNVRGNAAEALEKIGFDKIPVEGKVLALLILERTDEVVNIGKDAIPTLIAALKDDDWSVQYKAAEALEKIIEKLIKKGEFEEALETIRSTTTTIMNFYKGAFRTARKKNKTMGKDRELLKQRIKLLEKLESLTNEVCARVKEKEGLPNPLDEKEPMEWKGAKRNDNKNQNAKNNLLHKSFLTK